MDFYVRRGDWRCGRLGSLAGHGIGPSGLCNASGYKCCLGFGSLQLGLTTYAINGKPYPSGISVESLLNDGTYRYTCNVFIDRNLAERIMETDYGKVFLCYRNPRPGEHIPCIRPRDPVFMDMNAFGHGAADINDSDKYNTRLEREFALKEHFESWGHTLLFLGEYKPVCKKLKLDPVTGVPWN